MPASICCAGTDMTDSLPFRVRPTDTASTPSTRPLLDSKHTHPRSSLPIFVPTRDGVKIGHQQSTSGYKSERRDLNARLRNRFSRESALSKRSSRLSQKNSAAGEAGDARTSTEYHLVNSNDDILLDHMYDGDAPSLTSRLGTLREGKELSSPRKAMPKFGPRRSLSRRKRISLFQFTAVDSTDSGFERVKGNKTVEHRQVKASWTSPNLSPSPSIQWLQLDALPFALSRAMPEGTDFQAIQQTHESLTAPTASRDDARYSMHQATASASSVHLHTMRISQHLRSTSAVSALEGRNARVAGASWDDLAKAVPRSRHLRHASSSGFANGQIPLACGKVVRREPSSRYSSRAGSLSLPPADVSAEMLASAGRLMQAEVRNLPQDQQTEKENESGMNLHANRFNAQKPPETTRTVSNSSTATIGKSSKFKEELAFSPVQVIHPAIVKHRSSNFLGFQKNAAGVQQNSLALYDGSADDAGPQEQRPSEDRLRHADGDDAAAVWDNAFRTHRLQTLQPPRSKSFASLSAGYERRKPSRQESSVSLKMHVLKPRSMPTLKQPSPPTGFRKVEVGEVPQARAPLPKIRTQAIHARSRSSLKAWSRYPSHTRAERCGTAGSIDDVVGRDFANLAVSDEDWADTSDSSSSRAQKKRKSSKSVLLNKNLFKNWARLSKPHSAYFPKLRKHTAAAGHRSSLAMAGRLDYPELEMLAGLSPLPSPLPTTEVNPFDGNRSRHDSVVASSSLQVPSAAVLPPKRWNDANVMPNPKPNTPGTIVASVDGAADEPHDAVPSPSAPEPLRRDGSTIYESCVALHLLDGAEEHGAALPIATTTNNPTSTSGGLPTEPSNQDTSAPPPRLQVSKSLPATLRHPPLQCESGASALDVPDVPPLRRSTNDLCRLLQLAEIAEREKLGRAAGACC